MPRAPIEYAFSDDGTFPNSRLSALVYRAALPAATAGGFEELFARHHWTGAWRNGLFQFHHYHSTAHEVLGVYSGNVRVYLGGPRGAIVTLERGDVAVIPAGFAHKNEGSSSDFKVVGAYPTGTSQDMRYGKPGERPESDENIACVKLPAQDPVLGPNGPLLELWKRRAK